VLVVGAFALTRVLLAWAAAGDTIYPREWVDGDVGLYAADAAEVLAGRVPYLELELEYPPGSLPAIVAPGLVADRIGYLAGFVGLSVALDAAAFAGLLVMAARRGSLGGAWLWVVGVPLLGPIVYLRFDLLPAVLTVWALERVTAGAWGGSGAWLGLGFLAKIYPGFLALPVLAASRRLRVAVWAGIVALVGLGAVVAWGGPGVLPGLLRNVGGYHTERGIQVESTWSTLLMLAGRLGLADVSTVYAFMSHQIDAAVSPTVEDIATLAALSALAVGTLLAWYAGRRAGPEQGAIGGSFVTLALLLATGSVYSTQYSLWLLALGAVVLCVARSPFRLPVALLPLVMLLSQLGYPFYYGRLLGLEPSAIAVVGTRNLLVTVVAVWSAIILARLRGPAPRPAAATDQERAEPAVAQG
jgi:hypothetical protein